MPRPRRSRPAVLEEMLPYLTTTQGNPSSVHAIRDGPRAQPSTRARDRLAAVLGCAQREIVFTGSGTEADNLAIRGVVERWGDERGRHIVVSAIEHEAVLETARRLEEIGAATLTIVGCDRDGRVRPGRGGRRGDARRPCWFQSCSSTTRRGPSRMSRRSPAQCASATRARSSTRMRCRRSAGSRVHPGALGVDLLSVSAHKLYGPKGVGALWVRHGVSVAAQTTGGGQERNRRSATENVAGVVGFAAAAELAEAPRAETRRQAVLCRRLIGRRGRPRVPDATVTAAGRTRAAGFATFAFPECAATCCSPRSTWPASRPPPVRRARAVRRSRRTCCGRWATRTNSPRVRLRCTTGRATTTSEELTGPRSSSRQRSSESGPAGELAAAPRS